MPKKISEQVQVEPSSEHTAGRTRDDGELALVDSELF